jgi:hypothetical protein
MIEKWFRTNYPEALRERKLRRWKRKVFVAAGVNHIWPMDQHDKWKRFGLWLHVATDAFSGKILWLKIWWTNRNPRLICGWFLDTVQELGGPLKKQHLTFIPYCCHLFQLGMPLLTQSDPGSENYGVANAQTFIRQACDSSLVGTAQHKFKREKTNVKSEIEWSQLRLHFSPGYENLLDYGVNNGIYDPDDVLHMYVDDSTTFIIY